jgi:diguanylate cyclase (GGDEF)-like protein
MSLLPLRSPTPPLLSQARPWPAGLALGFLALQLGLLFGWPAEADSVAYLTMVAAPLMAVGACVWRSSAETGPARNGWATLALAMLIWSVAAFANLWHELVLGDANAMYRDSMLGFHLTAVPLTFLLASEWRPAGRQLVRAIDAVLALALGIGYFLLTWAVLTARGAPDDAGVQTMVWLVDLQNLFIAAGALLRWRAADEDSEGRLFGALASHAGLYLVLASLNNHFVAGSLGPQLSSAVSLAFLLLWVLALRRPTGPSSAVHRPCPPLLRALRHDSPILVAGALLTVSLLLIRVNYPAGCAGVLIAVFGYAVRNVVARVQQIAHGDTLQRDHLRLQTMAWTDALTGVANRHFLDQALDQAWRREARTGRAVAVLMIDIDHFKLLNDQCGHSTGDARLRAVAVALRQALVRPGDLLARYGGEEFIALLYDVDLAGALVVAERLRAMVEALGLDNPGSALGRVTVSVGAASASLNDASGPARLIEAADKALYSAKCAGRNQVAAQPAGG